MRSPEVQPRHGGVSAWGLARLFLDDEQRLAAMARLIAASMFLCMAFSGTLWLSARLYPLTPALGIVPPFPPPFDAAVAWLLVGLLLAIIVWPLAWLPVAAVVLLLVLLFAQDQSRLWPSFYTFFLLFVLLLGRDRRGGDEAGRTLAGMRFVVAAIYFWGGVHKLTPHFFTEEFPGFIRPLASLLRLPEAWLPPLGIAAAVLEAAAAVGLLTRRCRRIAIWDLLAMHAVIFVCIGPVRGHWNDSAWAWSLTMAAIMCLLFRDAPPFDIAGVAVGSPARRVLRAIVAVLVGIMPALNGVNRWDSALSFNIYTGNVNAAFVVMLPEVVDRLPAAVAAHVKRGDEWAVLDCNAWAMREFNAGAYPETRIFRRLFATVCGWVPPGAARLLVVEKATWFSAKASKTYASGDR